MVAARRYVRRGGSRDVSECNRPPFARVSTILIRGTSVGRKELEHLDEAAGDKAVVSADARVLLEMNGGVDAVRGENLVCEP